MPPPLCTRLQVEGAATQHRTDEETEEEPNNILEISTGGTGEGLPEDDVS